MAEALTTRKRIETLQSALQTERSSFDADWRELSDYLMPRRSRFISNDRNRGGRRNQNIIDSTARFAVRTLQSGLHAGLTSPARPWFQLTTPDPDLREREDVKVWLELVTRRLRMVFSDSNLYNCLPVVYGDMAVFGTSAMAIVDDTKDLFRCYAYPLGSYSLGLDGRNLVTTFCREYELSVRQVVEQFGLTTPGSTDVDWTRLSTMVKTAWDQGNYTQPVTVMWMVLPNEAHNPRRLESKFKKFSSYHWEPGNTQPMFLRESGFDSFPVLAPRWDVTGEDSYGTDCPGMIALGDVKQLQAMEREKGKAIKKMVDPPMVGSPELRTQKTSILPGDITYVRDPQHFRAAHEIALNLEHFRADMAEVRYRIQRAFYEDLFLMMARSDDLMGAARPTATEVQERHEEKLLALGPVLERTNDELLNPLIDRVFGMMERAGLVPPAPEILQGTAVKVEYVSIMAAAQKLVGVASQDRFLATIVPLAQSFPNVLDKIDIYHVVDELADRLGIDPRSIRTDEVATEIGTKRAQAEQAAAQAQQAQQIGSAVKNMGTTPVGTDSVLDRLGAGLSGAVPPMGQM